MFSLIFLVKRQYFFILQESSPPEKLATFEFELCQIINIVIRFFKNKPDSFGGRSFLFLRL